MGKSIRSKTKRSFRSKKREAGVYAATEAARLERLHAKLIVLTSKEKEGDEQLKDEDREDETSPGWCWFAILGLLDANSITSERMDAIAMATINR